MKLGTDALLRIIDVVRLGLTEGKDISQFLRELDLDVSTDNTLVLSEVYIKSLM